jgi:hypothetical protein
MNDISRLKPPYLELSFYFAERDEAKSFYGLVEMLVGLGATFAGSGIIHRGQSIRNQPFSSIHDLPQEPVAVHSLADVAQCLRQPDIRLVQVLMEGASGVAPNLSEIVGYESISEEAARQDHHPVAIWTEGTLFSGPAGEPFGATTKETGLRLSERFRRLVERLRPSYAAITLEYDLECPADLKRDPRSLAFRDFYISGEYIGADTLKTIAMLFRAAYIETLAEGLYVSCTAEFNPERRGLDNEYAQWQSVEVASLIASIT